MSQFFKLNKYLIQINNTNQTIQWNKKQCNITLDLEKIIDNYLFEHISKLKYILDLYNSTDIYNLEQTLNHPLWIQIIEQVDLTNTNISAQQSIINTYNKIFDTTLTLNLIYNYGQTF